MIPRVGRFPDAANAYAAPRFAARNLHGAVDKSYAGAWPGARSFGATAATFAPPLTARFGCCRRGALPQAMHGATSCWPCARPQALQRTKLSRARLGHKWVTASALSLLKPHARAADNHVAGQRLRKGALLGFFVRLTVRGFSAPPPPPPPMCRRLQWRLQCSMLLKGGT